MNGLGKGKGTFPAKFNWIFEHTNKDKEGGKKDKSKGKD